MAITTNNLISRQTIGSVVASSITFSNIPQTFTDLKIVISARNSNDSVTMTLIFNADTGSNYKFLRLIGLGTSQSSDINTGNTSISFYGSVPSTFTASIFSNTEVYVPNYTTSNYKSVSISSVMENNAAAGYSQLTQGLWSSASAVTSLTLTSTQNYPEYTTVSLYGISSSTTTQNTSVPSATGGDVITTDGTYWYHQFLYSGTFTPTTALTANYLVVAGGGGGGGGGATWAYGGGGGAGGLRSTVTATGGGGSLESALSLSSNTAYTVTVGAGGAGSVGYTPAATSGSNSVFSTITSTGGGAGGTLVNNASSGGSGGGGSQSGFGASATGGTRTVNQGYAGGNGGDYANSSSSGGTGGGGGSGVAGSNASGTTGGAGGNGVATSISGSSVTYAGGGGGGGNSYGAGGTGGGGAGANAASPGNGTNGTANRGSGGGGAAHNSNGSPSNSTGGNGGSGIVIVRYAVA